MLPNKLVIMTVVGVLLSSCNTLPVEKTNVPDLSGRIQSAPVVAKTTSLILEADTTTLQEGQRAVITIRVENPARATIDSVRSWLSFDPTKLKIVSIDDSTSDFDLTLSDERKVDDVSGIISIGRSTSKPLNDSQLEVAKIVLASQPFTVEMSTPVSLFDYQEGVNGHTMISHVEEGHPYNIMKDPANPTVSLTLQPFKIKR